MKLNDDWFDKFIKFSLAAIVITLIALALIDLLFSTSQVEKLKVTDKYYSSSRRESKPIVLSNGSVGISSDYKPEEFILVVKVGNMELSCDTYESDFVSTKVGDYKEFKVTRMKRTNIPYRVEVR